MYICENNELNDYQECVIVFKAKFSSSATAEITCRLVSSFNVKYLLLLSSCVYFSFLFYFNFEYKKFGFVVL